MVVVVVVVGVIAWFAAEGGGKPKAKSQKPEPEPEPGGNTAIAFQRRETLPGVPTSGHGWVTAVYASSPEGTIIALWEDRPLHTHKPLNNNRQG